jgi:hypothetical protein
VVAVAVSTVVVVSMGEVSVAVVSTGEASAVARSTAVVVSVVDVSPVAVSTAVAYVATVLIITDSPMMSSSATSAFRGGGVTRTDITVMATTITRTLTMDTAGTLMATTVAGDTVTTVAPVMDIAMAAEGVMDFATAAEPVTDTALATDQGMCGVRGVGDKPGQGSLKIRDEATCESSKSVRPMFGDKFSE